MKKLTTELAHKSEEILASIFWHAIQSQSKNTQDSISLHLHARESFTCAYHIYLRSVPIVSAAVI